MPKKATIIISFKRRHKCKCTCEECEGTCNCNLDKTEDLIVPVEPKHDEEKPKESINDEGKRKEYIKDEEKSKESIKDEEKPKEPIKDEEKPEEIKEVQQTVVESALLASTSAPVRNKPKRPPIIKPKNVHYKMNLIPLPLEYFTAESVDTEEEESSSCFRRRGGQNKTPDKKLPPAGVDPDKKVPPAGVDPVKRLLPASVDPEQPLPVRPSVIEFNFTREGHIGHIDYHGHVRPSVLKNLSFKPNKLYLLGERGSGFKMKGEPQDFYKLRQECLSKGILFEDNEFPAEDSSIYYGSEILKKFCNDDLIWKRTTAMYPDARFFMDGYSRFDVIQGDLGDCWLLGAIACLTMYRKLFAQIVPDDQLFDEKYAGIFHFRFWQYGRWVDVVVDDKIPTFRGTRLSFVHSSVPNEFWSALLEKAYAKLHGSYEALQGGCSTEATVDLTGGLPESWFTNKAPPDFFRILLKAYERASIITCHIYPDTNVIEMELKNGLITGHEYSVTKVAEIELGNLQKVKLIRIRNPWGDETEYSGPWSDKSFEWNSVPSSEQKRLGLTFDYDGEFWMSFKDFLVQFEEVTVCNLNPDSIIYNSDENIKGINKKWEIAIYEGEWVRGVTAGGKIGLASYHCNPQYKIHLTEADENDNLCTLVIGLMQKKRRGPDPISYSMGLNIYDIVDDQNTPIPLDEKYLKIHNRLTGTDAFLDVRELSKRFKLPKGTYVLIVTTEHENEEVPFLLRIVTEKKCLVTEHDNETLSYALPAVVPDSGSDKVQKLFLEISGKDREVDWEELKKILDSTLAEETKSRGFSTDNCRSMIAMMDADLSGKLSFEEFSKLWTSILFWKDAFYKFDKDHSGTFSGFEMREALEEAGFKVNNNILNKLMKRYGNKQGELNFEDFISCAIKIKTLIDIFHHKAENKKIFMDLDEWLETTVSTT